MGDRRRRLHDRDRLRPAAVAGLAERAAKLPGALRLNRVLRIFAVTSGYVALSVWVVPESSTPGIFLRLVLAASYPLALLAVGALSSGDRDRIRALIAMRRTPQAQPARPGGRALEGAWLAVRALVRAGSRWRCSPPPPASAASPARCFPARPRSGWAWRWPQDCRARRCCADGPRRAVGCARLAGRSADGGAGGLGGAACGGARAGTAVRMGAVGDAGGERARARAHAGNRDPADGVAGGADGERDGGDGARRVPLAAALPDRRRLLPCRARAQAARPARPLVLGPVRLPGRPRPRRLRLSAAARGRGGGDPAGRVGAPRPATSS